MALKHGDLQDTMLKNISIDEFEPKTGGLQDVSTLGFFVRDRDAGHDLYRFINGGSITVRDVELTPNPTDDGYYMVFVELDRDASLMNNIQSLLNDVQNLSGKLNWHFKTHLMDDFQPWKRHADYQHVFFTTPEDFMTVEQYQQKIHQEQVLAEQQRVTTIHEFFSTSALESVEIDGDVIRMAQGGNNANFHIAGFGESQDVMRQIGIHEQALGEMDSRMRVFNSMLGEMNAMPVGGFVVMYRPNDNRVLVGKPC